MKVGIKATEIAFSAKSFRKRFGIINATEKLSAKSPVPRKDAFVISRTSPIMREAKVIRVSRSPERTIDFDFLDILESIMCHAELDSAYFLESLRVAVLRRFGMTLS